MKNFCAKVLVRIKPAVKDIKGLTLKHAVESLMSIENLTCNVGSFYIFNFSAESECVALHMVEKIAQELLSNEVIETYEIRSLEEIDE